MKKIEILLLLTAFSVLASCREKKAETAPEPVNVKVEQTVSPTPVPQLPKFPNLQLEITSEKNSTSDTPLGKFDFKNYTYPLPRGWQDKDGKDITLENGSRRMSEDQIGMSYVTTKFGDVTGDGQDEAFVILKIVTAGAAIPQSVYVYTWKDDAPALIWKFRTGDRTDGGLKNVYAENGEVVIELYGQDRYVLGEVETLKITGDEEQLCCPDSFTRTRYKWNGKNFPMQGKRETYSLADPNIPPVENKGDLVNQELQRKK